MFEVLPATLPSTDAPRLQIAALLRPLLARHLHRLVALARHLRVLGPPLMLCFLELCLFTFLHFFFAHMLKGTLLQLLTGFAFRTVRFSILHLIASTSRHLSLPSFSSFSCSSCCSSSVQVFTLSLLHLG